MYLLLLLLLGPLPILLYEVQGLQLRLLLQDGLRTLMMKTLKFAVFLVFNILKS